MTFVATNITMSFLFKPGVRFIGLVIRILFMLLFLMLIFGIIPLGVRLVFHQICFNNCFFCFSSLNCLPISILYDDMSNHHFIRIINFLCGISIIYFTYLAYLSRYKKANININGHTYEENLQGDPIVS